MENALQKTVSCPLCGAQARFFTKKSGYTLYTCPSCRLSFVHPLPQSTAQVYGENYFIDAQGGHGYVDYDKDKEPMVPTFEEYLRRIERLGGKGTLLDVGAATGFFVAIANRMRFKAQGIEISPYAAGLGRAKGLKVEAGTLGDVQERNFDVITMLDVIEHMPDPHAELLRAHALLKYGGLLVINTPDIGSFYARITGKRWNLILPPEHLYYFNRRNIRTLLEACGFEVVEITTIGKSFTLSYIFKTLYTWQKLSVWKWLSDLSQRSFLRHITLPINLRDNMFLIARKR